MDFRYSQPIRVISVIILFFFCWTFGGIFDIVAFAAADSKQTVGSNKQLTSQSLSQTQSGPPKPEEKFQKVIDDITQIVNDTSTDTDTKKNKLKTKKSEIEGPDTAIKKQFGDTERFLKEKGLAPEILERHYKFVKHYEDNIKELNDNLDAIDKSKTKSEADAAISRAKAHLEKVKAPSKHVPLDPNKLPHRTAEPVWKEPRTKPEEFTEGKELRANSIAQKPILIASNGSIKGLISNQPAAFSYEQPTDSPMLLALADPPTDADLAETIEVKFTPAIQAKATELNHNPVKIYNWVRNNIDFVSTYGSIQGADYCLQTKQCNAIDTSSLLIALLRSSGIHARYVQSTIELPIEKVKNWVGGFTDSMEALRLLASAKIPTKGMTVGGKIEYARIEHVYVEAWIDYIPSRGARHKVGDMWIPLDASFKQYNYTQGIDIKSAVPFDAQAFVDQITSTATINETEGYVTNVNSSYIQQTMTDYQTQVQNYITQNYPNATVGDVLGKKEIIKKEYPYLLGTLPYRMIVKGATYSSMPDNLRHKITFNVVKDMYDEIIGTPINITKSLPELAGKKITLSYSPATQADEDVIISYLPKPHADGTPIQPNELPSSLPAYLINLKPELRIDSVVVATGSPVGMGNTETFKMTFTAPNESPDVITNDVQAGEYLGIALDLGRISQEQLLTLKAKLESTRTKLELQSFQDIGKDDVLGDILYATALFYFAKLNMIDNSIARQIGVNAIQLPSENIFSTQLKVNMFLNTPISASSGGMRMDVDRILAVVQSLDGNSKKEKLFMQASGIKSATLEHSIPEEILSTQQYPTEGISAIKAIKMANDAGIPIFKIDRSNIDSVIPQLQLDSGTISDIANAVNAGKEVLVSARQISFKEWTGCGYIITDPLTGASCYMISGGLSGSWEDSVWIDISWFAGLVILSLLATAGLVAIITLLILAIEAIAPLLIAATLYWVPLFILAYLLCDTYGPPPQDDITETVLCAIILTLLIHLGV